MTDEKATLLLEKPVRGTLACWSVVDHRGQKRVEAVKTGTREWLMTSEVVQITEEDGVKTLETKNSVYILLGHEAVDETDVLVAQSYAAAVPKVEPGFAISLSYGLTWPLALRRAMESLAVALRSAERWNESLLRMVSWIAFSDQEDVKRDVINALFARIGMSIWSTDENIGSVYRSLPMLAWPKSDRKAVMMHLAGCVDEVAKHALPDLAVANATLCAWGLLTNDVGLGGYGAHKDQQDPLVRAHQIANDIMACVGSAEFLDKAKTRESAGVIVLPAIGGGKTSHVRDIERAYPGVVGRPLELVVAKDLVAAQDRLRGEFPHFTDAVMQVMIDLRAGEPIRIKPTLFVGAAGCGKTRFCRRIAELLGVPYRIFDAANSMDSSFGGTARRWSTTEPCFPLSACIASKRANPLVIVDEIEKCATDTRNGRLWESLLQFLETESSSRYHDVCMDATVDVSHVGYLATSNDDTRVPDYLRSRFRTIRLPPPAAAHLPALARAIVDDIARTRGGDAAWWPHLSDDELELAWRLWKSENVRRLRSIVERIVDRREKNPRN